MSELSSHDQEDSIQIHSQMSKSKEDQENDLTVEETRELKMWERVTSK